MSYRDDAFYSKHQIHTVFGKRAIGLDVETRTILLQKDETISYDQLLLAVGGQPFVPSIQGLEGRDAVFTFTTLNHAMALASALSSAGRALVIGGGLIGLKAAESLQALGVKTTVVELASRILTTVLDDRASEIIQHRLEQTGLRIITEDVVTKVIGTGRTLERARLRDGEEIETDLIVVAIGVRPNLDLVQDTPIQTNMGIIVDQHMRTNVPEVYAAGDVAEAYDSLLERNRPIPILPLAYEQGEVAGLNMAGVSKEYGGGFPMNSLTLNHLPFISMGITDPQEEGYEVLEQYHPEQETYRKIVLRDNRVVGAIFVNGIDRAGIFRGLIKDQVEVLAFKHVLLQENFGWVHMPKEYADEKLRKEPE
jgi:NAD(P)H-nitrite reductase large subunit